MPRSAAPGLPHPLLSPVGGRRESQLPLTQGAFLKLHFRLCNGTAFAYNTKKFKFKMSADKLNANYLRMTHFLKCSERGKEIVSFYFF